MTLLPKVKLHALVSFPATVLDGTGVDVVKTNGTYQFNLDFGDFAPPAAAVTDTAQQNALLWNANTGAYTLVPMSVFATLPGSSLPLINGTATVGLSTLYSREDHIHPTDTSRAPLVSPTFTGDPKAPTPTLGDNDTSIATTAFVTTAITANPTLLRGYLAGLTLSAAGGTGTFGITDGTAADSINTVMMPLASAYTKTTAAWAVGSGNGALDTGAIAAASWYHVFLIRRPDTGVVDVLVSLSATAPTLPASYTQFRRIGSMKTAASLWIGFTQTGDLFLWNAPTRDVAAVTFGVTTALLTTLNVPTGVQVMALFTWSVQLSTPSFVLITSPSQNDSVPSATNYTTFTNSVNTYDMSFRRILTDTSGRIRERCDTTTTVRNIMTDGWEDRRGRDT